MKHIIKILLVITLPTILFCNSTGMVPQNFLKAKVLSQNKPLARVADEIITVHDVKRRMDIHLQEHYPNILGDANAKVQFYTRFYQQSLDELILQKLLVAEALDREIKISEPDIHQEMHNRFGSNPVQKLSELDITYEDCKTQIKEEIIVQNMLHINATMQALSSATPKAVITAYHQYLKDNPPKDNWDYQVITIKGDDTKKCNDAAQKTKKLLTELKSEHLKDILTMAANDNLLKDVQMNVSKTFSSDSSQLSTEHKSVLLNLTKDSFSDPTLQYSRATNSEVYRIFHLIDHKQAQAASLEEKTKELKSAIINNEFNILKEKYYKKLKVRYLVEIFEDNKNFIPFSIA